MTHIKRMICKGFKSFRKKTIINFDKGFTAIVGANGSGKSNIIDAFVFVLGELSAKTLRANNIKDLISNGGNGFGPAETASVEIIFDNHDSAFAMEMDEVSILRKIDRNGNGIYKLNGKRSTRKEIMNMLEISGLSPNSSNMIMQGELFRLINMNATERRELIEEIAGIASYNERKTSAEQELMDIQGNLGQISLLLNEVYIQLEQLEKEKNDAEIFLKLVDEEKLRQNALYLVKVTGAKARLTEMAEEEIQIQEKIDQIKVRETTFQDQILSLEEQLKALEPKIKEVQDSELLKMTMEMKKLKDQMTELKTSLKYAEKNLETYYREQKEYQNRLEHLDEEESLLKTEIQSLETNKSDQDDQIDAQNQIITSLEQKLSDIDSQYLKIKEDAQKNAQSVAETDRKLNASQKNLGILDNQIHTNRTSKEKLDKRIMDNLERIGILKTQIKEMRFEKKRQLGIEDMESASQDGIEKKIKMLEAQIVQYQQQYGALKPDSIKAQKELFELQSKQKMINQLNSGNRALDAISKWQKTNEIPGIYGTIAELGYTEDKYATAMEMAAGSRFNFVVVDHPITGENCINALKEKRLGRASFIPLSKIHSSPYEGDLPSNPKVYGLAVDLIEFEPKYQKAFDFIFGRTVIVEDLPTARALSDYPLRKVTLDGDIIDGSNLMTGGQKNKSKGVGFASNDQKRLEELNYLVSSYQSQMDNIDHNIKSLQNEISRLYKMKISGANKTKEISEKIAVSQAKLDQLEVSIKEDESEIARLEEEYQKLLDQKSAIEIETREIDQQLKNLQEEQQKLQNQLDSSEEGQLKIDLKAAEKLLKKLTKDASKIEIELAKKMTMLTETISASRKECQDQLKIKSTAIQETSGSISEFKGQLAETSEKVGILDEKISQKSAVLGELLNEKKKLTFKLSEQKTQLGQLGNDLYPLKMQLNTIEVKRSDIDSKILEWQCHINNEVVVPEEYLVLSEASHQKKLAELSIKKEGLGAVNLRAIDKYNEIQTRFEELQLKNEQVIQERESIIEFIETLENEKKKVFMTTFNAINKNFGYIFTRLSPGGEAKLELENLEDPFSGGVEILARPGEKKWCLTQAMSGGEKTLTIIALILGIQMHVPSPYYILDEIDAALDDANAALVAEMIKDLSDHSQFVIITHRDVTMARTDHLLGVSNREGVTSVVNLSIRNVMRHLQNQDADVANAV